MGDVEIIWDKNINKYIQSFGTESKRVAAVLFTNDTVKLLFITVYMSCNTGLCYVSRAAEDLYDVLTEISRVVHVYEEYEAVIGGDFNTVYKRNYCACFAKTKAWIMPTCRPTLITCIVSMRLVQLLPYTIDGTSV